jgi:hypothetical protein
MVCNVCRNMLEHQEGRYAKGTLDIRYRHHENAQTFQKAVQQNCYICRSLYVTLVDHLQAGMSQSRRDSGKSTSDSAYERDVFSSLGQRSFSSKAYLFSDIPDHTYRLKIALELDKISVQHNFLLETRQGNHDKPDLRSVHVEYRPLAEDLAVSQTLPRRSFYKDFGIVHQWLKMCKCYNAAPASFYPTRLVNLKNVKAMFSSHGNSAAYEHGAKVTVNLVETAAWTDPRMHYVTLSHCWGGEVSPQLLEENLDSFKRGIPIDVLPETFQDAIQFAASMDEVGYIWIDSLCIIQDDEHDWTKESADMRLVYGKSFLNLSATSASNSHGGLFKDNNFELLPEEEVTVGIEGLPQAYDKKDVPRCFHERSRFFKRQCTVVDASFWNNKVNNGPVNTRGWVLQERLMSPRVVHFCHDQVGWECACRDAPKATASCRIHQSKLTALCSRDKGILESITQRLLNLQGSVACPPLDLWAAIVNAYAKTTVSFSRDKLVALSGLAEIMSKETKCNYVAGLWQTDLISQLLWYVEPVFDDHDRSFSNVATFRAEYCAPSWSWAAIDTTSHGITYAKVAKQKLFVSLDNSHVRTSSDCQFGAVLEARITVRGKLRKAKLVSIPNNRFAWRLVDRDDLSAEPHRNVYLDCPLRDADCIDKPDAHVYVLPIEEEIRNSGTTRDLHLTCLLLRARKERGTFQRIGVTKLSPFMDRKALTKVETKRGETEYRILAALPSDASLPHAGYDEKTGLHRLHLV